MPFVKGIIISELSEGIEIFKYVAEDLMFNTEKDEEGKYLNGLRAAMNSLYTDFKN